MRRRRLTTAAGVYGSGGAGDCMGFVVRIAGGLVGRGSTTATVRDWAVVCCLSRRVGPEDY
jgi:hypothetical protein